MTIKIDGEVIPEEAIRFELSRLVQFYSEHMAPDKLKEQLPLLREKAEDQAIGAKLLIKEATRLDIQVPVADVDSKLEEMINNTGGREKFDKMMAEGALTEDVLRESIVRGRKVDLLIEKITEGASDPTEAEMKKHFEAHASEYRRPEQAQAQHILIKPVSDGEEDKRTAESRLLEIRKRIQERANFADEATAHSDCPSGKRSGGSLGWFSRGMMVPAFDAAVFSMKVGELSEVIETPIGMHLVLKTDHEDATDGTFEDSCDSVRDMLRHATRGQAITAYVADLKEKVVIERDEEQGDPDPK